METRADADVLQQKPDAKMVGVVNAKISSANQTTAEVTVALETWDL